MAKVLSLVIVFMGTALADQRNAGFRPARIDGIQLGQSREASLLRAYGKPSVVRRNGDEKELVFLFAAPHQYAQVLAYVSKAGFVSSLIIYPRSTSIDAIKDRFGRNGLFKEYRMSACGPDEGDTELIESSYGNVHLLHYPEQGIEVGLNAANGQVLDIVANSKPQPLRSPNCPPATPRIRK